MLHTSRRGGTPRCTPTPATIVLVHGAFAESASWNGVVADLHRRGYANVVAVANPLRGLQADAAYLRSVLDSIPGPIVVAGHSYGGSVMSEATEGADRVTALVYIASFQLDAGESTGELAAKFPGGELGEALDSVPFPLPGGSAGTDLYIRQDRFREVFAADVAPDVAALMAATQRPIAASALEDGATRAGWKTIPSWTMVTLQDLAVPAESMRFMADRAGSTTVEIDASHAVTVSEPDAVADLIDAAARGTAGADLVETVAAGLIPPAGRGSPPRPATRRAHRARPDRHPHVRDLRRAAGDPARLRHRRDRDPRRHHGARRRHPARPRPRRHPTTRLRALGVPGRCRWRPPPSRSSPIPSSTGARRRCSCSMPPGSGCSSWQAPSRRSSSGWHRSRRSRSE
jgi:alpha-beta hydrolase superfamily lysophospholipase